MEFCQLQFCLCRPLFALEENSKLFKNTRELFTYRPTFFYAFNWLACQNISTPRRLLKHCAELNFSNLKFEYLRENEFESKTVLSCLLWASVGSINEKKIANTSRGTATLNNGL